MSKAKRNLFKGDINKESPSLSESEINEISKSVFKEQMNKYWAPYVSEMMTKDAELALSDDSADKKIAADARERIYNRFYGKPIESNQDSPSSQIIINVQNISAVQVKTNQDEIPVELIEGPIVREDEDQQVINRGGEVNRLSSPFLSPSVHLFKAEDRIELV